MKDPKELTRDQVSVIYSFSRGVTGADFSRGYRITKEIRALKGFKEIVLPNGQVLHGIEPVLDEKGQPLKEQPKVFLHLKPSDLPAIWSWIKEKKIGDPKNPVDPATLIALEDIARALDQGEDYDSVVEDMSKEEEKEETKEEEKANA